MLEVESRRRRRMRFVGEIKRMLALGLAGGREVGEFEGGFVPQGAREDGGEVGPRMLSLKSWVVVGEGGIGCGGCGVFKEAWLEGLRVVGCG